MADDFPLSDTVSFETPDGWYDVMVTTAFIPGGLTADGAPGYRTVVDFHAPHDQEGTATLLEGLVRNYADAGAARAGHQETVRLIEERQVPLPLAGAIVSERKLRG